MSTANNPFEHILYEIEMYLATYKFAPNANDPLALFANNFIADSRAIHLRNLVVFFYQKKTGKYWHAGDYVCNASAINFLTDATLFKDIKDYASRATAHLLDERLDVAYKSNTIACYQKVHPIIINAIKSFLTALDNDVKPEYKTDWEDTDIQKNVGFIKTELLK